MRNVAIVAIVGAALTLFACSSGAQPVSIMPGADLRHSEKRTSPSVSYAMIYSFGSDHADGSLPYASLVNAGGTLYGTTLVGGYGWGTVFSITPSGTEKVLHNFGDFGDGREPEAALIDVNGTLYGTTRYGGEYYSGTVFSITPSGYYKVLHSFFDGYDGSHPKAGLINVGGTLYGTTERGGYGGGTVFSITPYGYYKVLHTFYGGSGDGRRPMARLLHFRGTTLYGTTDLGGANGLGTVFTIEQSGAFTVLHSFGGSGDGAYPRAGLIKRFALYGTTAGDSGRCYSGLIAGCGTIFSVTTYGTEKVLHYFGEGNDGRNPEASLLDVNGTFYGTTVRGGEHNMGTVFSYEHGTVTVLHSFRGYAGSDGAYPYAGLIKVGNTLYGTTSEGGVNCGAGGGCGTVFQITL